MISAKNITELCFFPVYGDTDAKCQGKKSKLRFCDHIFRIRGCLNTDNSNQDATEK